MRRRLLIITKDPEFDMHGEVVLGQCEPFTSGWSLLMIDPAGHREALVSGTYTDLRKIQEVCGPLDDLAAIRKRAEAMRALINKSVTETVAVNNNAAAKTQYEAPPVTTETPVMPSPLAEVPPRTPGGLMDLRQNNSVVVATLVQTDRAGDAAYLNDEFQTVLRCQPGAVLVDLCRVPSLAPGALKELVGLRDSLRVAGARFALCNVAHAARQSLSALPAHEALLVYETQASALAALKQ